VGKVQPPHFRNFKKVLRRHLQSSGHLEKLKKNDVREEQEGRVLGREKRISRILANISYYLVKHGRPNSDFTLLISVLAKAGIDCGDINHSSEFVAKFAPVCAAVVKSRLQQYFMTPLPHTGQKPPAKGVADKATWKHETRMVSGLVTAVSDSPVLLQAFLTGTKVCPAGSGKEMSNSLTEVWDQFISGPQVRCNRRLQLHWNFQYGGLAADGATLHCNVGTYLGEHYGTEGQEHDDYDPLHK
jgi:hypothetical protein